MSYLQHRRSAAQFQGCITLDDGEAESGEKGILISVWAAERRCCGLLISLWIDKLKDKINMSYLRHRRSAAIHIIKSICLNTAFFTMRKNMRLLGAWQKKMSSEGWFPLKITPEPWWLRRIYLNMDCSHPRISHIRYRGYLLSRWLITK